MYKDYHEAADRNNALVADVGQRFYELSETMDLYAEYGYYWCVKLGYAEHNL